MADSLDRSRAKQQRAAFKTAMHNIPSIVAQRASVACKAQAERLAQAQRELIDVVSGESKETIRVIPGKWISAGQQTSYLVVAGGPVTAKDGYDHIRALEFGTTKNAAYPFFFPPYHELKASMAAAIQASMYIPRSEGILDSLKS